MADMSAVRLAERGPNRWAALAAALVVTAIPGVALAQTPTTDTAATAESDMVLLEADTVTQDQNANTITAEGDVQVRFQGRNMRSDRLVYNLNDHTILANGSVQMVEPDGSVQYYDELQVQEDLSLGLATNLRARLASGASLAARTAQRRGENRSELSQIIYTSCPVCEDGSRPPTWSLRARRAIQDRDARVISYHGATLEVAGVPVLYLPYFAHPDPGAGARSGLLTPDIGRNRRLGTYYQQPILWAISPYQDLTVSPRLHSNVNPLLGFDYRRRFYSGQLSFDGSVTYEQDFDSDGNTFGDESGRGHLFGQGFFRLNNYWDWGFGVERASDDLYLRRYDISGAAEQRGPYVGDVARLVSQLYAIGQDENSFASVSFIAFQGLRETDSPELMPLILPVLTYDRVFDAPIVGGQLRWNSNATVLQRSEGTDTARISTGLSWRTESIFGPGIVVSPFAEARGDYFRINDAVTGEDTFGRGSAIAGAEVSWPLMRAGEHVDLIVEPVAMAAYGSQGGDDPRIVNEDSLGFEIDDSNLFRPNGAPNYDLWEPGGRMAVGVRATARAHNGRSASVLFGRRFRDQSTAIFTNNNNLEGTSSDYVAAGQVDLGRNFGAVVRTRLDQDNLSVQRIDAEVRGALGRFEAYGRYFNIDQTLIASGEPSEELTASVGARLARGWRVQFGVRRDLDSNTNLSQELRAIYEDDCTFLELAYTRSESVDRQLGPNEGFQIRVGLRTLGAIGGS